MPCRYCMLFSVSEIKLKHGPIGKHAYLITNGCVHSNRSNANKYHSLLFPPFPNENSRQFKHPPPHVMSC